MAVLRKQKRDHYTVIDNTILEDTELSLKAKGMLCLMLSLPDYWDFTVGGLTKKSKDGKTSVMAALNELEDAGYFQRIQIKENGKFAGIEYIVSETKMTDLPHTDFEHTGNEDAENPPKVNTIKTNTIKTNTIKRFIAPSIEDVREYINENGYSVDAERFIDYYTSNGWMVGKNHMKDWKATVRNWERKNGNITGTGNVQSRVLRGDARNSREHHERVSTGFIPMADSFTET